MGVPQTLHRKRQELQAERRQQKQQRRYSEMPGKTYIAPAGTPRPEGVTVDFKTCYRKECWAEGKAQPWQHFSLEAADKTGLQPKCKFCRRGRGPSDEELRIAWVTPEQHDEGEQQQLTADELYTALTEFEGAPENVIEQHARHGGVMFNLDEVQSAGAATMAFASGLAEIGIGIVEPQTDPASPVKSYDPEPAAPVALNNYASIVPASTLNAPAALADVATHLAQAALSLQSIAQLVMPAGLSVSQAAYDELMQAWVDNDSRITTLEQEAERILAERDAALQRIFVLETSGKEEWGNLLEATQKDLYRIAGERDGFQKDVILEQEALAKTVAERDKLLALLQNEREAEAKSARQRDELQSLVEPLKQENSTLRERRDHWKAQANDAQAQLKALQDATAPLRALLGNAVTQ